MTVERWQEDEQARVLFERMLSRRPVWVDSEMGQRTFVEGFTLDSGSGRVLVYDGDGNDRFATEYLLASPGRVES